MTGEHVTKVEIKERYRRYKGARLAFVLILIPMLFLAAGIALSLGSADISLGAAYRAVLRRFVPDLFQPDWMAEVCVWRLRLPRILMGIAAGMGLGISGCVTQSVLRNPMASPYTLGIASGAGFGAALAILTGGSIALEQYMVIGNAFFFALLCSAVILGLSSRRGATPETMILSGIAMTFLFSAGTTTLQYFGDSDAVKEALFWMVGDLGRSTWTELAVAGAVMVICIPVLLWKAGDLNVMGAGDEAAKSLGVGTKNVRVVTMVTSSFLVAGIVCFTGTIGFIGLVAPHICRMIMGNDNRLLIPASGLVGALMLVVADTVARRIIAPVILPVGVLTSFLGAPLFLYLIMRRRREYW